MGLARIRRIWDGLRQLFFLAGKALIINAPTVLCSRTPQHPVPAASTRYGGEDRTITLRPFINMLTMEICVPFPYHGTDLVVGIAWHEIFVPD